MSSDKKRKRSSTVLPDIKVTTALTTDTPPIVATTHGITLPPTLPFTPYSRTITTSTKKARKSEHLLHGSAQRIDYEGRELPEDSDYHRYYVGIFDPATNTVELHVAPKLHFSRTIKAHAERDREIDGKGIVLNNQDSRAALGRQFGTKKAQKALLSREMNKIDISDMDKTVTTSIISQVEENTKDMPTSAQLGTQQLDLRPIPPANKDATRPEDVYNLDDIIPKDEWAVLWVREWEKSAGSSEDVKSSTKSRFVATRVAKLLAATAATGRSGGAALTRSLKLLRYIGYMIEFYLFQAQSRGRLPSMTKAKKALGLDQVLVEGLYKRFAETTTSGEGGEARWAVSPSLSNKLLYYLAVLCLMADFWEVDLYELKIDLGMQMREITTAFKEVGCSVKEYSKTQYLDMKMTKAEATQHKRAVLKIPLEFPSAPRRRAAGGSRR
ncbi:RNA polymerase I associated factor, A49-like protein [Morchella snyderi]|nr:RNA polymerase I associated factor, A49-like protein [Morchella snyderi]